MCSLLFFFGTNQIIKSFIMSVLQGRWLLTSFLNFPLFLFLLPSFSVSLSANTRTDIQFKVWEASGEDLRDVLFLAVIKGRHKGDHDDDDFTHPCQTAKEEHSSNAYTLVFFLFYVWEN